MIITKKICSLCGKEVPNKCSGIEYITIGMRCLYTNKKQKEIKVCGSQLDKHGFYTDVQGHGVYNYIKVRRLMQYK